VSPILGIYASQISGHLFAPSGAYDSIATVTVGSPVSTITFSSIPSTYTHLQVRAIFRGTTGGSSTNDLKMQFNSDTGSNYSQHYLGGGGSSTYAGGAANVTYIPAIGILQDGNTASVYQASIIDLLEYANTNTFKTTRTLNGYDTNGSGEILLGSGNWRSTTAINRIDFAPSSGSFKQYSSFALYGIKGGN
jgi:hypothetical protein